VTSGGVPSGEGHTDSIEGEQVRHGASSCSSSPVSGFRSGELYPAAVAESADPQRADGPRSLPERGAGTSIEPVTHSPLTVLEQEVRFDRAPSSELVRLVGVLGELGEWDLETSDTDAVWSMSCESEDLLLVVALSRIGPEVADRGAQRWLLVASACEAGPVWRVHLDSVPERIGTLMPWIAVPVSGAVAASIAALLLGSLHLVLVVAIGLAAGLVTSVAGERVMRLAVERHLARQRARLLARDRVRALVERLPPAVAEAAESGDAMGPGPSQ